MLATLRPQIPGHEIFYGQSQRRKRGARAGAAWQGRPVYPGWGAGTSCEPPTSSSNGGRGPQPPSNKCKLVKLRSLCCCGCVLSKTRPRTCRSMASPESSTGGRAQHDAAAGSQSAALTAALEGPVPFRHCQPEYFLGWALPSTSNDLGDAFTTAPACSAEPTPTCSPAQQPASASQCGRHGLMCGARPTQVPENARKIHSNQLATSYCC